MTRLVQPLEFALVRDAQSCGSSGLLMAFPISAPSSTRQRHWPWGVHPIWAHAVATVHHILDLSALPHSLF